MVLNANEWTLEERACWPIHRRFSASSLLEAAIGRVSYLPFNGGFNHFPVAGQPEVRGVNDSDPIRNAQGAHRVM
jgi:hypothetical protein